MITIRHAVAWIAFAAALPASAVCLDPRTFVSGHHVPLDEEVRSAKFIVTGKVTAGKVLQEDRDDADGVTAHLWTVKPLRQLKGRLPQVIAVRVENTSSRYPMEVGETHLLFLSQDGRRFWVNSCGSSSALPEGNAVLAQVRALLGRASDAR